MSCLFPRPTRTIPHRLLWEPLLSNLHRVNQRHRSSMPSVYQEGLQGDGQQRSGEEDTRTESPLSSIQAGMQLEWDTCSTGDAHRLPSRKLQVHCSGVPSWLWSASVSEQPCTSHGGAVPSSALQLQILRSQGSVRGDPGTPLAIVQGLPCPLPQQLQHTRHASERLG